MDKVTLRDKSFRLYIPNEKILEAIDGLARRMNQDLKGKDPLLYVF